MSRSIQTYLPEYELQTRKLQIHLGRSLAQRADTVRKSRHLTWTELVSGLLQKLIDDVPPLPVEETVTERRLRLTREELASKQEEMFKGL